MKIGQTEQKRVIVIERGNEYQPRQNDAVEARNAFFYESYKQARFLMKELVLRMDTEQQAGRKRGRGEKTETLNNVIAFCAERGNGKTSALLSFVRWIRQDENAERTASQCGKARTTEPDSEQDHHYVVLDSVDPTKMEAGNSILKVVISRLFNEFRYREEVEEFPYNDRVKNEKRTRLIRLFQKCYHEVEILHDGKNATDWPLDELEQIAELGDSTNLQESFRSLVEEYLSYMQKFEDSYLVLPIDDADTNIEQTYQLLEDIRKYLFVPKLIIVMAANIQQMETTLEQSFLERYKVGLQFEDKGGMITVERCHQAAEFYLEKIIPGSRRIYLPSLKNTFNEGAIPVTIQYRNKNGDIYLPEDCDYQEQMLYLLHQKTGLTFLTADDHFHDFLPTNFRELSHFLAYFNAMENCGSFEQDMVVIRSGQMQTEEAKKQIQTWRLCFEKLEDYLLYIWAPSNLQQNARVFFQELTMQSWKNKHRYLLYNLPLFYEKDQQKTAVSKGAGFNYAESFREMAAQKGANLTDKQQEGDNSYVSVTSALDAMTAGAEGERYYRLCYGIHLYYSICLHKLILEDVQSFLNKATEEEEITSGVVDFLQDISIFCVGSQQKKLYGHFERDEKTSGTKAYALRSFLRYLVIKNDCKVMQGVDGDKADELEKSENPYALVYDPSYLMLTDADWFAGAAKNNVIDGKTTAELTLTILINWDVQRDIRHKLKQIKEGGMIKTREEAYFICYRQVVQDVFKKIADEQRNAKDCNEAIGQIDKWMHDHETEFISFQMDEEWKKEATVAWVNYTAAVATIGKSVGPMGNISFETWKGRTAKGTIDQIQKLKSAWVEFQRYLPKENSGNDSYATICKVMQNLENFNLPEELQNCSMKKLCQEINKELKLYAKTFEIQKPSKPKEAAEKNAEKVVSDPEKKQTSSLKATSDDVE